ncbi:MAG TPA: hypothetical protein VIO58_08725 [Candidatus Methanoperedens sp.]
MTLCNLMLAPASITPPRPKNRFPHTKEEVKYCIEEAIYRTRAIKKRKGYVLLLKLRW